MSVVVGNQVIFKKYSPDEIKIDGEDFLILNESDIVAIVE
jgi:chaperonin GroES